ncbi:MAG TPA: PTS sugar transporter subunit IIA [Pirellulaceae bacterium]|nr:PTS sugar transporter subunit IIA [Pirellulaceae bacterium]HMO90725.1 PTS sugar transporter subunit IIA [Pirellulaceae bacterium]HMP67976.1 PTS sugar transporter subunit IIA [Pirellulaceae bacterium]
MSNEDFDSNALATFLHLTPAQVEKMAERGKLPGRKVGGKWRFSQAEIHHWFETRIGVSDPTELIQVELMLERQPSESLAETVRISDLMMESAMCIPLLARTRNSVIQRLCDQASQAGVLWDANQLADLIRQREDLHPTALENGVALLHPRRPQPELMAEPFIALGVTTGGIPFGGPRGVLTDLFFLVASCDDAGHLKVLARLSRLISNRDLLEHLRIAGSPKEAIAAIAKCEDAID